MRSDKYSGIFFNVLFSQIFGATFEVEVRRGKMMLTGHGLVVSKQATKHDFLRNRMEVEDRGVKL